MDEKKYDLEDRLIKFAVEIINLSRKADWNDYASRYYQQQLIRSSGSVALNFGEFLGASSQKDKLNKLNIAHKEIKECRNNILIQIGAELNIVSELKILSRESLELIKILRAIIKSKS
ncbi:four helix bundle protein [Nonlabens ponticola]|uniref:Four helix bundle protein n=1 Tax=Nonlabens ponticola TaxID=2496866 RepID=A0A3S9MXE3_9FLAO|nr:four helix bundle protein [Nonlabens ponticola]AZQ43799.1 four helix bundle protein [Nonlabens ponticola]